MGTWMLVHTPPSCLAHFSILIYMSSPRTSPKVFGLRALASRYFKALLVTCMLILERANHVGKSLNPLGQHCFILPGEAEPQVVLEMGIFSITGNLRLLASKTHSQVATMEMLASNTSISVSISASSKVFNGTYFHPGPR